MLHGNVPLNVNMYNKIYPSLSLAHGLFQGLWLENPTEEPRIFVPLMFFRQSVHVFQKILTVLQANPSPDISVPKRRKYPVHNLGVPVS